MLNLLKVRLLFGPTNVTTDSGLSLEMKTFYSDYLIDMAQPNLVHDQFGQKRSIPKNGGKTVEFRKYSPLAKALTPLTEGTTPTGKSLNVTNVTATVAQYGDYVELSDVLMLTAIDNNLVEATKLLGQQAGLTLDTVTREVLVGGSQVIRANGRATRTALVQGTDKLTVELIRKAVRELKLNNAPKFGNYYVAIIHPDTEYDLMDDNDWKYPHQYCDPENMYLGELGAIAGVRFVESTEAKVWTAAGASNANVYATLILGENAYGTVDVAGGGLQHIVKQLGSAGTSDALNMRATVGWKALKTAVRLVEQYMIRIETTSSFATTNAN